MKFKSLLILFVLLSFKVNASENIYHSLIPGALEQVDSDGNTLCGVIHGAIYCTQQQSRQSPNWKLIDGSLKHVSVSNRQLMGVSEAGDIYYKTDYLTSILVRVGQGLDGGKVLKLKQLDLDGNVVCGVTAADEIYCADENIGTVPNWFKVDGYLKHISVSNKRLLGVNANGSIYYKAHYKDSSKKWVNIPGGLKQISLDNNIACGVTHAGAIYCSEQNFNLPPPIDPKWFLVRGALNYVSVNSKGFYGVGFKGVTTTYEIYWHSFWQNPQNKFDVNNDGILNESDGDALLSELKKNGTRELGVRPSNTLGKHFDVDNDGWISPLDTVQVPPVQEIFWVAPTGKGVLCSFVEPCSLDQARYLVRGSKKKFNKDIYVKLRGGTYQLTSPFTLTPEDSGANGYKIIYQAYTGVGEIPILSGGIEIKNFSLYNSNSGIWRTQVPDALKDTRQLYVDGKRAVRARGEPNPTGYTLTDTGFSTSDPTILGWNNPENIELTGFRDWKHFRCPLDPDPLKAVTRVGATTHLNVASDCWYSSQEHKSDPTIKPGDPNYFDHTFNTIARMENALELLDDEGEWYLDRTTNYLYYKPIGGKDPRTSIIIAPILEQLVTATGKLDEKGFPIFVQDITFRWITFSYATWLSPNTKGYAEAQTGWHNKDRSNSVSKTPGNITLSRVKNILFEGNRFIHLGAAALTVETRSQDVRIIGNRFEDISSTAIQIGDIRDQLKFEPDPPSELRTARITVSNNYITGCAVEFNSAVGIFVGQAEYTKVEHNEITDLPLFAISIGWGWDYDTFMNNNIVRANHIYKVMNKLRDGGAIYTMNHQPESKITENWIHDLGIGSQQPPNQYNISAIYHDEGSHFFTDTRNVLERVTVWLAIWSDKAMENTVTGNWMDQDKAYCKTGTNYDTRKFAIVSSALCHFGRSDETNNYAKTNNVNNNTIMGIGLSSTALADIKKVKDNAGLELKYQYIKK